MDKEQNFEGVRGFPLGSFAVSWEQRKVGELLIERNEQAPMSEEYPLMAFIANEGVEIEEGYVEKINKIIYQKYQMSRLILENDYYRILFNK